MKAPPPTTNLADELEAKKRQKRAAWMPVVIGFAVLLPFAIYAAQLRFRTVRVYSAYTNQLAESSRSISLEDDLRERSLSFLEKGAPETAFLLLRPSDRPLTSSVVDLPPYSGAVRQSGFTRAEGQVIEEVSFWTVAASAPSVPPPPDETAEVVAKVTRHYVDAATKLGFVPVPRSGKKASSPPSAMPDQPAAASLAAGQSHVLVRPTMTSADSGAAADQTLIIRVRPAPHGIRILLWLRYVAP